MYREIFKLFRKTCRRIKIICGALFLGQRYDLGHGKERQISPWLCGIQKDHRSRYYFAAEQLNGSEQILDLACGVGYGAYILGVKARSKVVGVDLSEQAINYAKKHYSYPSVDYRRQDAREMVSVDRFDGLVSFETLEHIEDEVSFVRTLRSLALLGARLCISTPNEEHYPYDEKFNPYHVRHHRPSELDRLLESNGWRVVERCCQRTRVPGVVVAGTDGLFLVYVAVAV
jgi:SAM-dependent methyltransferase